MANRIFTHKMIDDNRRAVVKFIILSDGTNESNTAILDASQLQFALNTSGNIMTSNVNPKSNYRTTIRRITGQVNANGNYFISWQGDAKAPIITAGGISGAIDYNFDSPIGPCVFSNPEANANGMILVSSQNAKNGDAITLILDLKKDPRDYDQGQTRDPKAFNR